MYSVITKWFCLFQSENLTEPDECLKDITPATSTNVSTPHRPYHHSILIFSKLFSITRSQFTSIMNVSLITKHSQNWKMIPVNWIYMYMKLLFFLQITKEYNNVGQARKANKAGKARKAEKVLSSYRHTHTHTINIKKSSW